MSTRIKRRCQERLKELALPQGLVDVRALVAHVAESRGRAIHLHPVATSGVGPCGAWIPGPTADHVFFEAVDTTRPHQDHIICHEVGHILCDHEPAPLAHGMRLPIEALGERLVDRMLSRTRYGNDEEREAEIMASLLLTGVATAAARQRPRAALEVALEYRRP